MYEYAYVSDGKVTSTERLDAPLPAEHPKVKAGVLVPIVTAELPTAWVRGNSTGFTVENGVATRTYEDRAMTAEEIADAKGEIIAAIKTEAGDLITHKMPTHKQLNWLAQGLRNVLTLGPDVTKWPKKARDDAAAILAAFSEIEAIRARSDAKEAEVAALEGAADVAEYPVKEGW